MALLSAFARRRQERIAAASNPNNLAPTGSRLVSAVAFIGAATLTFCAAWQSAGYAFALGAARSESTAYVFAAGAVAAAVMAPIALATLFSERIRFGRRLAALFLALWCLGFGVLGSLGYVSTAREASNAERAAALEARQHAKARHDAAAAELAQLADSKSTTWRAARAKELQQIMADAGKAMKAERAVAAVDPQASAIAFLLAAFGVNVTVESVTTYSTIFVVSFYEVASAVALAVARAVGGSPAATLPVPTLPLPLPAVRVPDATSARPRPKPDDTDEDGRDDPPAPPPPPRKRGKAGPGRPANVLPGEVVDRLRKRGGKANGSLAGIGKMLGAKSKTGAHRVLHRCAEMGLLRLETDASGCRVALA